MSKRAQDNIAAIVVLAVFVGVIYLCQDFGPRARMIPLPLAVFGIILTLVQLVWQNVGSTDKLRMDMITVEEPTAPAGEHKPDAKPSGWKRETAAYGMVFLFVALILAVGPMLAVFMFTTGYFVVTRQYSWQAGLLYTALLTAVLYLMFRVALGIQPYYGLLAPLFD